MEGGLPMFNCLLQHKLKSLCSSSGSTYPSKWVYAVFWRILPRNFPPPKWEFGGRALDLIKGNKRNWILVWEDGHCDFDECERVAGSEYMKGRFGSDVFFKMSHEVYNYGEGLVGKVAADSSHRWVFRASAKDDSSCFSSWKISIDPVTEDLKLVINTQRKFSYLQSIPGISAIPRPNSIFTFKPTNPYTIEANGTSFLISEKHQLAGSKRIYREGFIDPPIKSINLGWNTPQNGLTARSMWSLPPLFPAWSCNFGSFLSTLPYSTSPNPITSSELSLIANNMHSLRERANPRDSENGAQAAKTVKVEPNCAQEDKSCCLNPNHGLDNNKAAKTSIFGTLKERDILH